MLLWLLQHVLPLAERVESSVAGDSRILLTARAALAAITSFVAAIVLGPFAIRWLKGRFRERIDSASSRLNELHAAKGNTPTMGGLFLVAAIVVTTLLWGDLASPYVQLALFLAVSFAALGAVDDWIKLRTSRRGLTVRQKFVVQAVLALAAGGWLYSIPSSQPAIHDIVSPIGTFRIPLGILFIGWTALVLTGSSNGVNLTDGLDGLASGCLVTTGTAAAVLTYLAGHARFAAYLQVPYVPGCGELSVVLAGMVGAVLGFLWYNAHPAQVFMGDTGSLPLGALLAFGMLAAKQELLLLVIGGVVVIETVSVMAQVGCNKLLGFKPLRCSPLHNHFVFRGDPETQIVSRFWIASVVLAIAGTACVRLH